MVVRTERVGTEVITADVGIRACAIPARSSSIEGVVVQNADQLPTKRTDVVRFQDHILGELVLNPEMRLLVIGADQALVHMTWIWLKGGVCEISVLVGDKWNCVKARGRQCPSRCARTSRCWAKTHVRTECRVKTTVLE